MLYQEQIKGDYMRKPATLITGANGEMGHGLIAARHEKNYRNLVYFYFYFFIYLISALTNNIFQIIKNYIF